MKSLGLCDAFGIDHQVSRRLSAPILQLDLLDPAALQHLREMIAEPNCIFVHMAPPCGTASRARLIQRSSTDPPILRTDRHPDGLPHLTGDLAARVQAANSLYHITVELGKLCLQHAVLFSIENPSRSFMWATQPFRAWLSKCHLRHTIFHHCEYGSARRKCTRFVHCIPGLHLKPCSGSHPHEKWGRASAGWATSEETAYPWQLCRAFAAQIVLLLQDLGALCPTPAFASQEATLQAARGLSNHQSGKASLPLVPEFKHADCSSRPLPPLSRALSTPRKGYVASAEGSQEDKTDITVGIHWSPEEFISEALKIGHPEQVTNLLPPELQCALDKNETTSLHAIGMERTSELRRWISLANRHAGDEAQLKTTLGERRAEVLKDKRILLLRQLIADSGHIDLSLPDDLARGFDLTGKLPPSSFFADKFRPASLPCASLRGVADRARDILISSAKSSGDHDMDVALYEATLKERDKGFLVGPVDPSALPAGSTITRRFGVQQKGKLRPIDDYKASMVDASVTQTEGVSVHGVDHIAAMVSERMKQLRRKGGAHCQLLGKCWDLAAAYKQGPLSDEAYDMDAYLMVFNPASQQPEVFQQRVLPFGTGHCLPAVLLGFVGDRGAAPELHLDCLF